MSGERPTNKGSFGGELEELVKHFPHERARVKRDHPNIDSRALQEKRDIHALLFEMAWKLQGKEKDAV